MTEFGGPKWADSVGDLEKFIILAHGRSANIPQEGAAGNGIHIGIVDSACRLPNSLTNGYNVNQNQLYSFIDNNVDESVGHCRHVFNRMSAFAPNAEYTLYQAVNSDGNMPLEAYSDAITAAISDRVDLINLSAGDPWPAPIDKNPNIIETKRLIDENIPVVAAAGNYYPNEQDNPPPVHCPSALEPVISVGGLITKCPYSLGDEPAEEREGPYFINGDCTEFPDAYCGEQGCVGGESCITNQEEKAWGRNPLATGGKPDVLAPMHTIESHNEECCLGGGTSFAAPLVTGSLASIFSEIRESSKDIPPPHDVRKAARSGSVRISDSQIGKYNAMGTRGYFRIG